MRWAVLIVLALGVAQAGPQVEIRAHTQLALGRVKLRDHGMVVVTGHLHDKLTGEGIANERVYVTIAGRTETAYTTSDGSFSVLIPAEPGPQQVTLSYRGAGRLEEATPLIVTTDPAKSQLELAIGKISDDPTGAKLRVTATSDEGSIEVPVELAIGSVGKDDFKPLRTVTTGREFIFTRREAGGAGTHRLRASFAGDDMRQSANIAVTLELTSGTTTTMKLSATRLAFEDELGVSGKVLDDDDKPIARAAVTLMSGDRRLAQGVTDDSGKYRFEVEAEIIGHGQFGIQVKADPGKSFVRTSHANPEVVRIDAPQPVPVSYTVAAFIATVIAAGGFFAARTKPWQKLRRPAPPAEVPSEEGEIAQLKGGLVVAKPGVVATLRRPNDDGFSGVVRDTVRGRPVAEAVVNLVLGDVEPHSPAFAGSLHLGREIRTAADGSFAIEKLGQGEWRAEVAALGHVTERFTVTIPHRGELRGVRVDLVPVRERVFQLYRRAAEPVLPESRLWGIWSPRQIVDHVRSKRPSPALTELTNFVEEIYFSPRLAAETVLPDASAHVDRAINERARR